MKIITDPEYVIKEGDWIQTNYDLTLSHRASATLMGLANRKLKDCGSNITVFIETNEKAVHLA